MSQPKPPEKTSEDLFRNRLDHLIDLNHPLCQLAREMDWESFEKEFGKQFKSHRGRPAIGTRRIVGLHYLKYTYALSDEEVVARWLENPYWQYFCAETYFQSTRPVHPSSLTRWRKRFGEAGSEELLAQTIEAAKRMGGVKKPEMKRVNVDTTVQEKAIPYPTDGKLYRKSLERLVKQARAQGIELRQSYARMAPRLAVQAARYAHAKQYKRMRKPLRKLKVRLGRVYREVERKLESVDPAGQMALQKELALTKRLLEQNRKSKKKLYSLHAPEVECLSKGKVHKRYEFGVKVGIVTTNQSGWVLAARSFPGNPYDGHTLEESIEQAEILSGVRPTHAFVDKSYRGVQVYGVKIFRSGQRRGVTRRLKKQLRRRSTIEGTIGHMKNDGSLGRNWLRGELGDAIHAVLCGAGHNIRLLLNWIDSFLRLLFAALYPQRKTRYAL